jgi:hypothetical protein
MKILLINSNPVVSRLTALSARKEDIEIDEIQEVTELSNSKYDIVFVDADSWSKDVNSVISENIETQKRVLFYGQDDKEEKSLFDMSILKPFLPSEVSAVIRSVEEYAFEEPVNIENNHFNLLDEKKDELELPKENSFVKDSSKEELEELDLFDDLEKDDKIESVKAEKNLDEKSFDEQLAEAFPFKNEELNDRLSTDSSIKLDEFSKEELFELDLSNDSKLEETLLSLDDKENTLKLEKNTLLDFDSEKSDTFDLNFSDSTKKSSVIEADAIQPLTSVVEASDKNKEPSEDMGTKKVKKSETKILDEAEVANIKDILENDTTKDEMALDDLMTPAVPTVSLLEKKEKKKKSKKEDDASLPSDALIETLTSLPVETLKGLLAGATVKVSIKFPKR